MSCAICETRKPRRYCPGVRGDICAICCGTEREQTVSCPFECGHLQEARLHERPPEPAEEDVPNLDIEITDRFLEQNSGLLTLAGHALMRAALEVPGAVDADVREALGTLIRTYRTLESGLYYESRPNNPLAAAVHQGFQSKLAEIRQQMASESGVNTIRDSAVLGVLVFLERVALRYDNGRQRGRAFLHFLYGQFASVRSPRGDAAGRAAASPIVIP